MFDLDSSLCRLQGMCCSENSKLEKIKSFDEMSSDASMEKKKNDATNSVSSLDTFFYDVKLEAELSSKVRESKRKYFPIEKGSHFLKFSFAGLIPPCF